MEEIKYWIWFSRIENLTPKTQLELLKQFKNPANLWNKKEEDLIKQKINEKLAKRICEQKYKKDLDKYLEYMQKNAIELINIYSQEYPENLKNIYDPPAFLYIKGNKEILNQKSISIVGCRNCTTYGKNTAMKLAYNLSNNNINIVSGLARGIDAYSHIGCLKGKAKTIAVVGCGLDRVYPEENRWIYNKIIENDGAIISEHVIGTKPLAQNFPRRNRIISALSKALIVVEAKEKSGTLITVDFALEQGKDIYVVPGNIDSRNSVGTNELIKQGARVLTKIDDIFI